MTQPTNEQSLQMQSLLKNKASDWGADLVGFCQLNHAPILSLPNHRFAVLIAVKLSDAVLATIEGAPSFVYFQHYRAANALLDQIAFRVSREIEKEGFSALPVAASQSLGKNNPYCGVIPHKTVAVLAGLGFVGKSGLFLSEKYGSKVRLATILTDFPLQAELPVIQNGCGDCTLCQKACPADAIYGALPTADGERNFDAEKCSRYMKEHFQDVGRGSVCGVCIKVCPYNHLR